MRETYRTLLTVTAMLLALGLVLEFWSFTVTYQVMFSSLVIVISGIVLRYHWRIAKSDSPTTQEIPPETLPPPYFKGKVILTCGNNTALFNTGSLYRETEQGWYLQVKDAEHLFALAQKLSLLRPNLAPQVFILLAMLPEHHLIQHDFTQYLMSWQRAIRLCRLRLKVTPPVWTVCWVSPLGMPIQQEPVWFFTTPSHSGMQIHQQGIGHRSVTDWCHERATDEPVSRLSQILCLECLLNWQKKAIEGALRHSLDKSWGIKLCAQVFCCIPIRGESGNLWQQHITDITALPPNSSVENPDLPLPEWLLPSLPSRRGICEQTIFWCQLSALLGAVVALMMLTSFFNNQRLIYRVGESLARYHRLDGSLPTLKRQAQQRLRREGNLLEDWQHHGEPYRYGMGLYQGKPMLALIDAAASNWAPLPPAIQSPKTTSTSIHIHGIPLFDSGQSALKSGANTLLFNALMAVKAQQGMLIIVSGHTDNTGDEVFNQKLSLKRAESVRDWIKEAGGISEDSFAVAGFGARRPITTNDTPEGRALNRRVDIHLVPLSDAPVPQGSSTD